MILTVKRKIKLNIEQISYFNKSIIAFNSLLKSIDDNISSKKDDIFKINFNNYPGIDRFAIVGVVKEIRSNYYDNNYYFKLIKDYELINDKKMIKIEDKFINMYGFNNISIDLNKTNIIKPYNLYKAVIRKEENNFILYLYFVVNSKKSNINPDNAIAFDYSIYDFYVDSNNNKPNFPDFSKLKEKISYLHKKLMSKERESKNYLKTKNKLNKTYKRITQIRDDYLNKLSMDIINKYDLIIVENLDLSEICVRGYVDRHGNVHSYGKHIYQKSYRKFIEMLKYKSELYGKKLIMVGKYFPSSKKCSFCGFINNITDDVNVRTITCPKCNSTYDRDYNAAINLLLEGKKIFKNNT